MPAKDIRNPDESAVFREVATRKLEAERVRVQQLADENKKLREMAADLQKKISIAGARPAELEKRSRMTATEAQRDAEEEVARVKDRFEKQIADLKEQHQRELQRTASKGERVVQKLEGVQETAQGKLADLQDQLNAERQARTEAETRLRAIETGVRRVQGRAGQVTGYEADTPEDLIELLAAMDPERPGKIMRNAVRELRAAAGNVERAFGKAEKDDNFRGELQQEASAFSQARALPNIEYLTPAPSQLV
jgi:chromosome segregation ATPase